MGIIIFFPSAELFFYIQKTLSHRHIYIDTEIKNSHFLTLNNTKIYKNDIKICSFKKATIKPFILFNTIYIENLKTDFNFNLKQLNLYYTLFKPYKIHLTAKNENSILKGEIDLKNHYLKIYFSNPSNSIKNLLKKDAKGYYYYAIY
ncbi:MAG: hypothetical protein ABGX26_03725 [Nautiliaceae bacterium]